MRREDYEPPRTPPESPFRCFDVKCLKCSSYRLTLTTEFDDEAGELRLVMSCPRCRLAQERQRMHFGLFDEGGDQLACVIAVELSPTQAKIRQMAVRREYQGNGLGSRLICCLEDHLARRGFIHLSMRARTTAVGFYEKQGYVKSGHEFTEVGIPHIKMEKRLSIIPDSPVGTANKEAP